MEKLNNIYQSLIYAIECSSYNYYKIYHKLVNATKDKFNNTDTSKYHFEKFIKNSFPSCDEMLLSLEVYFTFLNDCLRLNHLDCVKFDKTYYMEIYSIKTNELNALKLKKQKLIEELTPINNSLSSNDKEILFSLANITTLELLQTTEEISKITKEIQLLEDIRKRLEE